MMSASGKASLADPGISIESGWVYVSPDVAKSYLEKIGDNQRESRRDLWTKYSSDMKSGKWTITSQGFEFDHLGRFTNGQNRCLAVIDSGMPQWFLVTRGVPFSKYTAMAIDRAGIRTMRDCMNIAGMKDVKARSVATANVMTMFGGLNSRLKRKLTDIETMEYMSYFEEGIVFSLMYLDKKFSQAPIAGAVAKAFYHVKRSTMEDYCDALCSVECVPSDGTLAARLLRELVWSAPDGRAGPKWRKILFMKSENSINYFVRGKDIARLHGVKEDIYPIEPDWMVIDGRLNFEKPKDEGNLCGFAG